LAERVAGHRDGVAAEVVQRAAPRLLDVPEVRAVGAAVRLARADPEDAADPPRLDDLPRLDHRGGEDLRLRVAVERARAAGRVPHRAGLARVAAEGLRAHLVPLRLREQPARGEVLFVRQRDHEEVDVVAGHDLLEVGRVLRDVPAAGEGGGAAGRARGVYDPPGGGGGWGAPPVETRPPTRPPHRGAGLLPWSSRGRCRGVSPPPPPRAGAPS